MVTVTLNVTSDVYSEDEIRKIVEIARIAQESLDILKNISDDLSLPKRGDIQIELLSPSGTKSILLPHREYDIVPYASYQTVLSIWGRLADEVPPDGYIEWPFMSVHFWGEDPSGEWTLTFRYRGLNNSATFEGLNIKLYGTLKIPEAVVDYSDCNSTCVGGCAKGGSSEFCHSCTNRRDVETLECIDVCPSDFEEVNGYCYDPNHPKPQCDRMIEGMCQCCCCSHFV